MLKVKWDVEELVALINIYRNSADKNPDEINEELQCLSNALERRAIRLGIIHDEKYRNLNGMKLMYQNVVYVATDGRQGMSSASSSMRKVYGLLSTSPDVFELILEEFSEHYCR